MKHITIAHLYPREMSIYGDMGNIIALKRRLEWRNYRANVVPVEPGDDVAWESVDLVFGGGGQDSGQLVIGSDLLARKRPIEGLVERGVPMLLICGMYQLFGRGFTTMEGQEIPGIGILGVSTTGGTTRMIGNVCIESERFGRIVGFENHSGQTTLESDQLPLGRVTKGYGNNPHSGYEGAVRGNVVGTYLHGPVLPKNPDLADALIAAAVKNRYGVTELPPLNNEAELAAANVAAARPQ